MDIERGFEVIQNTIPKKNHLAIKKWFDSIYHKHNTEEVSLENITKAKIVIEEFIAETDDNILEECLQRRLEDFKQMKYSFKILSDC